MKNILRKIKKLEALEATENSFADVMDIPENVLDESYNLFWEVVTDIVEISKNQVDRMTAGKMLKHRRKELIELLDKETA